MRRLKALDAGAPCRILHTLSFAPGKGEMTKWLQESFNRRSDGDQAISDDMSQPPPPYALQDPHPGDGLPQSPSIQIRHEMTAAPPPIPVPVNDTRPIRGALYKAVQRNDAAMAQLLLSSGADPDDRPTCAEPAIVCAVRNRNAAIVDLLLQYGANLEVRAPAAATALYHAIDAENAALVEKLLSHGAHIQNAHPCGGQPALYHAICTLSHGAHRVSSGNVNTDIVRLLLQKKIDLEAKPPGGCTCVYKAAQEGYPKILELLLSHGAKAECKAPGGPSALHQAAVRGDLAVATMLLAYGANVNATPPAGNTAIYEAVKRRDISMMDALLSKGADIHRQAPGGMSTIALAAQNGDTAIVRQLLGKASEDTKT